MIIQNASICLAEDLAYLINLAGEGIPKFLWSEMAQEEQDPMAVGKARASRKRRSSEIDGGGRSLCII